MLNSAPFVNSFFQSLVLKGSFYGEFRSSVAAGVQTIVSSSLHQQSIVCHSCTPVTSVTPIFNFPSILFISIFLFVYFSDT